MGPKKHPKKEGAFPSVGLPAKSQKSRFSIKFYPNYILFKNTPGGVATEYPTPTLPSRTLATKPQKRHHGGPTKTNNKSSGLLSNKTISKAK